MRIKYAPLLGAMVVLVVFALQYPLSTSWPIGGDAASYITKSQHVGELWKSRYPLAQVLLGASAALPISWPDRFVWVMTAGQIATGAAAGWLVWRTTKSYFATAAALFLWGISTTTVHHHFEEATLAQLWSLPPLLLWLERLYSRAWLGSLVLFGITFVTHPYSGFLALLIAALFLLQQVAQRDRQALRTEFFIAYLSVVGAAALAVGVILIARPTILPESSTSLALIDALRSGGGAELILAPFGILYLLRRLRADSVGSAVTCAWLVATAFLATNNLWHLNIAANRFATYFFLLAAVAAAWAVPPLLSRAMPWRVPRTALLGLLVFALALQAWQMSARVYAYYESPSQYGRLHADEQVAFRELSTILAPTAVLGSSEANRHSEWLPILANRRRVAILANDPVWKGDATAWQTFARAQGITHVVVLHHTEEAPAALREASDMFPVVYSNSAVTVFRLP